MSLPEYRVYALRFASAERRAPDNFLVRDIHDEPMALDFYVWLIQGEGRTVLVDTGFSEHSSERRNRRFMVTPVEGLERMGVKPEQVQDVILTHLHYDHSGNFNAFPDARLHVQDTEIDFATGRNMCHHALNHFYEIEDMVQMLREIYAGRVDFHDGEAELAPGISLHRVGGHTDGLQVVRVHTQRGWVVLASDAVHFYRNLERGNPFPAIFKVGDLLEGYRVIRRLADTERHIVPGHDPDVLRRYPRLDVTGVDVAVLHEPPSE